MSSNFFQTYKSTLIKLILIVLFVSIVVEYINKYKRKLFGRLDVIERKIDHIQSRTVENNFIHTGYEIDNLVNFRKRLESSFFLSAIYIPNQSMLIPLILNLGILNVHYDTCSK